MRTIDLTITKQTLTLNSLESLPVQGSENSIELSFAFDETWENYPTRRAYFQYHYGNWKYLELDSNNKCIVPKEFLAKPGFKVLIRGYNSSNAIMATNVENIPVEYSPSLADSTKVVPVAIRSGDDAIDIKQDGDVVTISLNDEFESNTYYASETIVGEVVSGFCVLIDQTLGDTETALETFRTTYTHISIPYSLNVEGATYSGAFVATLSRYSESNLYYIASLIPLDFNHDAIVTLYIDNGKVKATIAIVRNVLNLARDDEPTQNSINFVNSGSVYIALNVLKTTIKNYSDSNLTKAKSYSDSNLSTAKAYTDTSCDNLSRVIATQVENMQRVINQAIASLRSDVSTAISSMEVTIDGKISEMESTITTAISTMNTTINGAISTMNNNFSTLQTKLENDFTTLQNNIESDFSQLETSLTATINAKIQQMETLIGSLQNYDTRLKALENAPHYFIDSEGYLCIDYGSADIVID